jgi:hypothetical protein
MTRRVTIELGELHPHGVDPADSRAVSEALAAELRARVLALGLPPHLATSAERLSIRAPIASARGATLGSSVAEAIVPGRRDR